MYPTFYGNISWMVTTTATFTGIYEHKSRKFSIVNCVNNIYTWLSYTGKVWQGKFGEFGELSVIHQTQPPKLVVAINKIWLIYSFTKKFWPKSSIYFRQT